MKITAKFAAAASAALIAAAASAFAQGTDDYNLPQGFYFYNEVSSDVVKVIGNMRSEAKDGGSDTDRHHEGSPANDGKVVKENWMSEFGGIGEKVGVGYNSEKFWFELAPKFQLRDNNQNFFNGEFIGFGYEEDGAYGEANTHRGLNADDLSFAWTDLDWGVRFTPFDIVDMWWNTDVWTPGSYLPGADEHMAGGNLGSDGIALIVKPIDGLRLSVSVPMGWSMTGTPNFLDAEREDYDHEEDPARASGNGGYDTNVFSSYWFRLNLGADYTLADFITVGGTITDLVHRQSRGYGLYVNANLGNIFANLGYTYGESAVTVDDWDGLVKIHGKHKINAAGGVAFGDLTASVEALFNLPVLGSYSIYDLYAGVKVGYDLLPNKFNVGLRVYTAMDIKHSASFGHSGAYDPEATIYDDDGVAQGHGGSSLSDMEELAFYYLYWGDGKWNDAREEKEKEDDKSKYNGMLSHYGAAPMIGITPSVTYRTGKHTFNAAANLEYWLNGDGGYAVKFPVSWTWNFN